MEGLERLFHRYTAEESSIRIWVEKQLAEIVVLQRVQQREREGDPSLYEAYHDHTDDFYDLPAHQREIAFAKFHAQWFEQLGYVAPFAGLLREFPALTQVAESVFVAQAISEKEEAADLNRVRRASESAKRTLGIRLKPARFLDPHGIERYLRHEWTHLADTLDPSFEYETHDLWSRLSPGEESLLRERYRVIWCASIDGRIERLGRETTKAMRKAEFDRYFRRLPETQRDAAFGRIWNDGMISHPDLVALGENPNALRQFAEGGSPRDAREDADETEWIAPPEGSPCPLCRFPTFRWVLPDRTGEHPAREDDAHEGQQEQILARIGQAFPEWRPEQGVCDRCYERYEFDLIGL